MNLDAPPSHQRGPTTGTMFLLAAKNFQPSLPKGKLLIRKLTFISIG